MAGKSHSSGIDPLEASFANDRFGQIPTLCPESHASSFFFSINLGFEPAKECGGAGEVVIIAMGCVVDEFVLNLHLPSFHVPSE